MIICACNAVSHRDILAAIDNGEATVEGVGQRCGAGTCCGSCTNVVQQFIDARVGPAEGRAPTRCKEGSNVVLDERAASA